jgi:hypothetical protein
MIFRLFVWWYTDGWKHAVVSIKTRIQSVMEQFSVGILVGTLWEPWKQIKSYAWQGSSVGDKMRVAFDNGFARLFGFILRMSLITIALVVSIFVGAWSILLVIIWPLIPLLPIGFAMAGLGVFSL